MRLRDMPIRRRLTLIILGVTLAVMLLMRGAFFYYEYLTFREATLRHLSSLGQIVATNSTAALAFQNQDDAREILGALRAEQNVVAAALYDRDGRLFARYPDGLPDSALPVRPGRDGYAFSETFLSGFQPVLQKERQGTLFLKFDMSSAINEFLFGALRIAAVILAFVMLVAWGLAHVMQRQITRPVLALAETARQVSEQGDFTLRAARTGDDEVGRLTDSFNQMLARIGEQDEALRRHENQLQTIIENLDEGLAVSDLNGQMLHFNRAALELHGFSSLEVARQHLQEFDRLFELATLDGTVLPLDQWPLARILRGEHLHDCQLRIRGIL